MNKDHFRAIVVAFLVLAPIALYFFLKMGSSAVYNTVPFQYSVSPEGDTVYHTLPEFSLTGPETGQVLQKSDLLEGIWLISFIDKEDEIAEKGLGKPQPFPVLMGNLEDLYEITKPVPYIKFLLVSTAIERDDISDLVALRDSLELPADRFFFATGTREEVFNLGLSSFQMPAFQGHQRDSLPFTSQTIAMTDKEGRVRKYYIGTKSYDVEKLLPDDLRALLQLEYKSDFQK